MPDIDTLLEIGPRLYLLIPTDNQHDFRLVFPMRGVVSTNLKTWTDRGLLFAPGFLYKIALKPNGKSSLTTSFGVNFGTNRLTEYFYQVDPEFAQPDRPAYRTRAGYIGTRTSVIYSISAGRFRYFTSIGAQSYKNAANADSPLFRKNYDATIIGGIVWSFFKSDARAYR